MFDKLKTILLGELGSNERNEKENKIKELIKLGGFVVSEGMVYSTISGKPAIVLAVGKGKIFRLNGIDFTCEKFILLTYEDTFDLSGNNIIELSEEEFRFLRPHYMN